MQYKLYLDVFFIINVIVDFIALIATKVFLNQRIVLMKTVIASIIGGLWSVIAVAVSVIFKRRFIFVDLATYFLLPVVMIIICSDKNGNDNFSDKVVMVIKGTFVLFIAVCILSGTCNLINTFVTNLLCGRENVGESVSRNVSESVSQNVGESVSQNFSESVSRNVSESVNQNVSDVLILALGICVFTVMFWLLKRHIAIRRKYEDKIYDVTIVIANKSLNCKALMDTGNMLVDPYSKRAVHIISTNYLKKHFGLDFYKMLLNKGFRYVSYNSIGNEKGLIKVIDADEMIVCKDDRVIYDNKATIGLYDGDALKNSIYKGILNASLN